MSSRRTRPRSRIENRTSSSLGYAVLNTHREGDRRSGQGGGRRTLIFTDGDVPQCIQHSRKKYLTQQHDPSRSRDDDKDTSTAAQTQAIWKGMGSSKEAQHKTEMESVEDGGSKEAKHESGTKDASGSSMNGTRDHMKQIMTKISPSKK